MEQHAPTTGYDPCNSSGEMSYELFLFDADDTLFDFRACERRALSSALKLHGHEEDITGLHQTYMSESAQLWRELEQGKVTKDFLKTERFRRAFVKHAISLSPEDVGHTYLEMLPEAAEMIESALEICELLARRGRVGIITNGFETVQRRRLASSPLAAHIEFMVVSEACGYVKPDVRFFEHAAKVAGTFEKSKTLVIGDRLETDIAGAHAYGLDACWFNPNRHPATELKPKFEIQHLRELKAILG